MANDYYIVLGISRGADLNKIKKAYRTNVKKYHPDVLRSEEGRKKFLEIREAYETLSDETKRRRYDEALARQGSGGRRTAPAEIIDRRTSIFDEMDQFFSTADDFFSGFLPGFFDIEKERIREKDLYFEAVLSPREAASGGLYPITIPVIVPCARCGTSGVWEDFFCPVCSGYGRVHTQREFSLSIPPNVQHGTTLRLSLEDIGLRNIYLTLLVSIDPYVREEEW